MGSFFPLFSLQATHEFFAGESCSALDFVPTADCERLIGNGQLLLRHGAGGIRVFYDADRAGALPDTANFDFGVYSRDNDFQHYTDVTFLEAGQKLYFDSARTPPGANGRLSQGEYASLADLSPENKIPTEIKRWRAPPLFLVRISASASDLESHNYFIPFRARRAAWQYYISGKGITGPELYVAAPSGEEAFDYRGEATLPNGRPASLYRSRAQLPLLQYQPSQYSLRERFNGRVVVRKLPTPSPRSLAREQLEEGEVLISQMFVNL